MTIQTEGDGQNSYITIAEANALLLNIAVPFMPMGTQLATDGSDDAYLLEAARDLETLWAWAGELTDRTQPMSWPRTNVPRPGQTMPREPGWFCDDTYFGNLYDSYYGWDEWIFYKINYLNGNTGFTRLDPTIVPQEIKEAQALLAILRKQGGDLLSDNQDNAQGLQLPGGLKIAYVNAVREAADIHKRTAQFGQFVGGQIIGA